MPKKTLPLRGIHPDEEYSQSVVDWAAKKYPTVDVPETFEVFADRCRSLGSMHADFDAALRTWIRNGIDRGYGGIMFKQGRAADPKWAPILNETQHSGFRAPLPHETPSVYRTEYESWKRDSRQNVTPIRERQFT